MMTPSTRRHSAVTAAHAVRALQQLGNRTHAVMAQRYFKTGPGEYGEGDVFLGIRVPQIRKFVRGYEALSLAQVQRLLRSKFHEARLLALFVLVRKFRTADEGTRRRIYDLYLRHTRFVNNWDLVDASAQHIVGAYLAGRSRRPLRRLARSRMLWERRIAVIATFHFIKADEFTEALAIAKMLLTDPEDLIHKAVGWMLREVGKRDKKAATQFLDANYHDMPRTMLRYAIEQFPALERQRYLRGSV